MFSSIMIFGLKALLELIPIFFAKSAKREEYERLVRESIKTWEANAGRSSETRQEHEQVTSELEKKWSVRWSQKKPTGLK